MTTIQKQLLVLIYDGSKHLGLTDMLDPDINFLVDNEYAEISEQQLSITEAGKNALLNEQAGA